MEIAFLVIAIIGLLALTSGGSGGSVSGNLQFQPGQGGIGPLQPGQGGIGPPQATIGLNTGSGYTSYQGPGTPWSPSLPSAAPIPQVPSQGANVTGSLFTGASQIGTQLITNNQKNSGSDSPSTGAVLGIAAIGIVAGIGASLLAAHRARLQGAKTENEAVDKYIPVFDSFVKQLTQAYNSRQVGKQEAASVCQQFDQALYQTFRSFVGQPGTAWNDSTGMAGKCDKSCTVGCCVYFGDLGPVLNNMSYVLGYPTSKWGAGDPRISGRTITVPKVYPSKYSSLSRDSYTITLS